MFSQYDLMQIATPNSQRVLRTTFSDNGRWIVEQFETTDLDGKRISPDATPTIIYFHDGEEHARLSRGNNDKQAWEVQSLSDVDAKLELPMLQAKIMASINGAAPVFKHGSVQLDGSDRSLNSNAFRFRIDDADGDPLYLWAAMKPGSSHSAGKLAKASASLDCLEGGVASGVTLENWQQVGGLSVPLGRKFVAGLDEEVDVELVNLTAESTEQETFENRLKEADSLVKSLVESLPVEQTTQEAADEK